MNPLNISILIALILIWRVHKLYQNYLKSITVVTVEVVGYAGLPPMLYGRNSQGEIVQRAKCDDWCTVWMGKVKVTVQNGKVISIN